MVKAKSAVNGKKDRKKWAKHHKATAFAASSATSVRDHQAHYGNSGRRCPHEVGRRSVCLAPCNKRDKPRSAVFWGGGFGFGGGRRGAIPCSCTCPIRGAALYAACAMTTECGRPQMILHVVRSVQSTAPRPAPPRPRL